MSESLKALRQRLDTNEPVEGLVHTVAKNVEVTTAELTEAVAANPEHPVAQAYATSCKMFAGTPDQTHNVNVVDLQALLDDRLVVVSRTVENGVLKETKSLGESRKTTPAVE